VPQYLVAIYGSNKQQKPLTAVEILSGIGSPMGFAPTVIQILAFQAISNRNRRNITVAPRHAVVI